MIFPTKSNQNCLQTVSIVLLRTAKRRKMKKFKNFEELYSFMFIFEFFGLQYFSLRKLSPENFKTKPGIYRILYMLFMLVIIISMTVGYIIHDHTQVLKPITMKNLMLIAVQQSMNFGILLVLTVSLVQSYVSTNSIEGIFMNTRDIIQLCVYDFKIAIDFKRIKSEATKTLRNFIIFIATLHGTSMLIHMKSSDELFQILLGMLPIFLLALVEYKFVFYVDMVNRQLEFFKNLLEDIFKCQLIRNIDDFNFHITVRPIKAPNDPIRKLRAAWKIYMKIYDISGLINDSIGLTVLVMLMSLVIALTVSGYEIVVILVGGLPLKRLPGDTNFIFS